MEIFKMEEKIMKELNDFLKLKQKCICDSLFEEATQNILTNVINSKDTIRNAIVEWYYSTLLDSPGKFKNI